jgi:hypothetical protein
LAFVLSDGRSADEAGAAFLTRSAAVAAVGDDLLWCRNRSRITVATTGSPNTVGSLAEGFWAALQR